MFLLSLRSVVEGHFVSLYICACGHEKEDATHYLFNCTQYDQQRRIFDNLDAAIPREEKTFLYGKTNAPTKQNIELFEKISEYIRETKRFD